MAKTVAERQKAYRLRRNDGEGDRCLNTWVRCSAYFALKRLAHRYRVTLREMLERVIISADDALLKTMEFDSPEFDMYMDGARRKKMNPI